MNNVPLLSIITVCLNAEKTIKNTIASLYNQTSINFEYILVDGNSTDATVAIIKSFEDGFREKGIAYKWISEPDTGIYNAFNKGVALAQGDWISFLGSDDILVHNAIHTFITNIPKEQTDFVYSNIKVSDKRFFNGKWSWKRFKRKMTVPHVGGLHYKNYFNDYGLFDESYQIAGDYELLLRAKDKLKTLKINKVTAVMSEEGISNKYIKKTYQETTRAKIETANVPWLIAKLDYQIWLLKYRIKKAMYALAG